MHTAFDSTSPHAAAPRATRQSPSRTAAIACVLTCACAHRSSTESRQQAPARRVSCSTHVVRRVERGRCKRRRQQIGAQTLASDILWLEHHWAHARRSGLGSLCGSVIDIPPVSFRWARTRANDRPEDACPPCDALSSHFFVRVCLLRRTETSPNSSPRWTERRSWRRGGRATGGAEATNPS